jgi:hypothetical protein
MAEAVADAAVDPLKESAAMTTMGGRACMCVEYGKSA